MLEKNPDEIVLCSLECILMPNGEIISLGKTVGLFKNLSKALSLKEEKK